MKVIERPKTPAQRKSTLINPAALPKDHILNKALRVVMRNWFLAYSRIMAMEMHWTGMTPYGATDGRRLLLNPEGLKRIQNHAHKLGVDPVGLLAFLLVHESLHALLGHSWRLRHLHDHKRVNIATDLIINLMIMDQNKEIRRKRNINYDVFPMIPGGLLDEKLDRKLSGEQVYRLLKSEEPPQPEPQPGKGDPQEGDGDPEEGNGGGGGANEDDPNQDSDDGDGDGDGGGGGCEGDDEGDDEGTGGSGSGEDGDEDGDGGSGGGSSDCDGDEESGDGNGGGGSGDEDGGGGSGSGDDSDSDDGTDGNSGSDQSEQADDDFSDFPGTGADDLVEPEPEEDEKPEDVIRDIEERTEKVILQDAVDRATRGEGGSVGERIVQHRDAPSVIDWTEALREWLTKTIDEGWERPFNPQLFTATGLVGAGRQSKRVGHIGWAVDVSGSVGCNTVARFVKESGEALDSLKPEGLHLFSFSHRICDIRFAGDTPLEPGDEIPDRLEGGGGTNFDIIFDWVEETGLEFDCLVILTDGYAPLDPSWDPGYPVLWLSSAQPPSYYPFGEVIMLPADDVY